MTVVMDPKRAALGDMEGTPDEGAEPDDGLAALAAKYRVKPGRIVTLADHDPADTKGWTKNKARKRLKDLRTRLNALQELLYATEQRALLIILQGMDTGGKDGVIKRVVSGFNPQGFHVTSFKVPTEEELAHDFLWRVHRAVPRRGIVGVFNRSHYEDVLVVRVENLVPEPVWRLRYDAICQFEQLLADSGVVTVKFFLHLSNEEQRLRLKDRLDDPTEHWKFRVGDLDARAKWDAYMAAYEAALEQCSSEVAPWYVVPADKKWYRDLVVAQVLVNTLEALRMEWPPLEDGADGVEIA